eukprot:11916701-Heterocapsa_arctica.AAC.1
MADVEIELRCRGGLRKPVIRARRLGYSVKFMESEGVSQVLIVSSLLKQVKASGPHETLRSLKPGSLNPPRRCIMIHAVHAINVGGMPFQFCQSRWWTKLPQLMVFGD